MMKYTICLAILSTLASITHAAEPLRVMSFNVRFGKANDGENHWDKRKTMVAETVREFAPDMMGTQETLKFQADYIHENVEGYTYFGRSRMKTPNEHCGIFYRTSRFTQLAGGHFWLSESPEVPESKSWDSSLPRMVSWVLLSDKENEDGDPVLFINTHFDHRGAQARLESAKLIRKRVDSLRRLADNPLVIITGDFNTGEATEPYKALLDGNEQLADTFRTAHAERGEDEGTFNSWSGKKSGQRIDWILADSRLNVSSANIVHFSKNGRNPSDHFPITAVLEQKP